VAFIGGNLGIGEAPRLPVAEASAADYEESMLKRSAGFVICFGPMSEAGAKIAVASSDRHQCASETVVS
jgi:hypothetical protein